MRITRYPLALLLVIILLILSLFLQQDKTELGDLVLISGIGVEKSSRSLAFSAEIVVNEKEPYVVRVTGSDLNDCMERIGDSIPGIPYWGGTALLLLNDAASADLALLAEIYAYRGMNPGVLPVLAVGDAADLLSAGFGDTGTSLGVVACLGQQEQKPVTLMDLLRAAAEDQAAELPRLYLNDEKARLADGT